MIMRLDGEIGWDVLAEDVVSKLDNASGDITVHLDSPGGDVFEGVKIFNSFKAYSKGKVNFIITALGASIASYIALAGDTLEVFDNSTYMIHNASSGIRGDAKAMRLRATTLDGVTTMIANEYVKKTNKSLDEVLKMMDDETYLFGNDIVKNGFADNVVMSDALHNNSTDLNIESAQKRVAKCNGNCAVRSASLKNKADKIVDKINIYKIEADKIMEKIK